MAIFRDLNLAVVSSFQEDCLLVSGLSPLFLEIACPLFCPLTFPQGDRTGNLTNIDLWTGELPTPNQPGTTQSSLFKGKKSPTKSLLCPLALFAAVARTLTPLAENVMSYYVNQRWRKFLLFLQVSGFLRQCRALRIKESQQAG